MDTKDEGAIAPHARFIQRSTNLELSELLGTIADELRLRGCLNGPIDTSARARLLLKACANLLDARVHLRAADAAGNSRAQQLGGARSPAASVSDSQHGAAQPEASQGALLVKPTSTTTGAAGDFRCQHSIQSWFYDERADQYFCEDCNAAVPEEQARALGCAPSLLALTAESSGGAARAEGAHREDREAGRAESSRAGRVDLSAHLAALKAAGGSR